MPAGTLPSLRSSRSDPATASQHPGGHPQHPRGAQRDPLQPGGAIVMQPTLRRSGGGCAAGWETGRNIRLVSGGSRGGHCWLWGGWVPLHVPPVLSPLLGEAVLARLTPRLLSAQIHPGLGHELSAGTAGAEVPHRGRRLPHLGRATRNAGAGRHRAVCGKVKGAPGHPMGGRVWPWHSHATSPSHRPGPCAGKRGLFCSRKCLLMAGSPPCLGRGWQCPVMCRAMLCHVR